MIGSAISSRARVRVVFHRRLPSESDTPRRARVTDAQQLHNRSHTTMGKRKHRGSSERSPSTQSGSKRSSGRRGSSHHGHPARETAPVSNDKREQLQRLTAAAMKVRQKHVATNTQSQRRSVINRFRLFCEAHGLDSPDSPPTESTPDVVVAFLVRAFAMCTFVNRPCDDLNLFVLFVSLQHELSLSQKSKSLENAKSKLSSHYTKTLKLRDMWDEINSTGYPCKSQAVREYCVGLRCLMV